VIAFSVIVAAIFGTTAWLMYRSHTTGKNDYANEKSATNTVKIHFFFADWCPHCKTAKTPWKEFCAKYNGRTINKMKIECNDQDCSNDGDGKPKRKKMMRDFKIESYPTIKAVVGNNSKVISYDAKVTVENLDKFMDTILYETPTNSVTQTVGMLN